MKKALQLFFILLLSVAFTATFAQSEGDYRSNPGGFSNNWNTASNWQVYTSGAWTNMPTGSYTTAPDANNAIVEIQAGHTITLDKSVSVDDLTINGALVNTSSTLYGLYLYGDLTCNGTVGSASDNIAVSLDGGGSSNQITGTGTIYLQYLTKINNGSANGYILNNADLTLVRGSNPFENLSGAALHFTVNSGTLRIPNATTLTTATDITFTFDGSSVGSTVVYSKSGNQTIYAGTYEDLVLSESGAKSLGGNVTVNGTLSIQGTTSFGLNGNTLTWGSSSVLEYAGSSAQTFGTDEWSATPPSVTINNPNGVAANGNKTITGTLTVNAGSDFNNGTYTFTAQDITNNGSISGTGLISLNGSSASNLSGSGTFENLAANNGGGIINNGSPTINSSFQLVAGGFINSGAMNFADGVQITQTGGTWGSASAGTINYAGTVDVTYSTGSSGSTGAELPASTTALNDLTLNVAMSTGASATVNGTVSLNAVLTIGGGTILTIKNPFAGTLANNLICSGTLYVDGAAKATVYLPTSTSAYNALTIDRSGGVYLSGDLDVTTLTFVNGNLYTGSYTLTVDPANVTGETDGSYIVGTVKTNSQDLTASASAFSSLGLTFSSTFSTGGNVILTRTTGSGAAVTVGGNSGFDRVYQLDGTMSYTGKVTCDWFGSESSGRNLSKVAIHEFVAATSEWITRGPDAAASGSYNATSTVNTDVSSVSQIKYTITDDANPLPVELTSFTASVDDRTVTLNWETATEVDNYGFEIERASSSATPGQDANWETLGFVAGAGNSNSPKQYSFVDDGVFFGTYQYRLKQIDTDGAFEYFDVIEVQVGEVPTEYSLKQNYPNPFNPSTVIEFGLPETANVTVSVYNLLGEKVATLFSGSMNAGMHKVDFNANNLSSGIYIYSLEGQNVKITKKMMLMK